MRLLRAAGRDHELFVVLPRAAAALLGLLWIGAFGELARPALALVALAVEASVALLAASDSLRLPGLLAAELSGASALLLVDLNGGVHSPLVPIWLVLAGAAVLAAGDADSTVVSAALAGVTPAVVLGGAASVPLAVAAVLVCVGCAGVRRRHSSALRQLETEAATDGLTGLWNRLALESALGERFAVRQPQGAVVFLDLDGFREINRQHGHAVADRVLRKAGAELARTFPDDFVARAGGDEFVLVIERRCDLVAAARTAARVLGEAGKPELRLTATAGVAVAPEDGTDPETVLAAADQALRWGKADGKARVVRYDERRSEASRPIGEEEISRLWLEDRISIVVQPIVDLRVGRVRGYEALARFDVEGDGSPLRWFAHADRCGMRRQLEVACLIRALRVFANRPVGTYLSVNLSPDVMELDEVRETLNALGDLHGLVLELTEDAVVDNYDRLGELLAPHLARGLLIAVDDFGAGQANLRHAWAILPRYLKLDRTLVADVEFDKTKQALVESIVSYAERVGAYIVAEGVETTAELKTLRRLGVSYAQGFRFAGPDAPWPSIDIDHSFAPERLAAEQRDDELLVVDCMETSGVLQRMFVDEPGALAAVLEDAGGRVVGLLTRNRLLVTLGVRFGFALYGDRPALRIADREFLSARPGTGRKELVARAMARDESRRYDPILLVDDDGRLLRKLTIQELLEPEAHPSAAVAEVPAPAQQFASAAARAR